MVRRTVRVTRGWISLVACPFLSIGLGAQPISRSIEAVSPRVQVRQGAASADFLRGHGSDRAHELVDWILRSGDHQDLPFVVVDKIHAHVFVFNKQGVLLGAAPALVGLARGDDGVPGIGDRPLSRIQPQERTTPAGRFVAGLAQNLSGQDILWVDYEQGISLHPVRSVNPKERRLERLASPSASDNRISYGCINVPLPFWQEVVMPAFTGTPGIVYVLPEIRTLRAVFAM